MNIKFVFTEEPKFSGREITFNKDKTFCVKGSDTKYAIDSDGKLYSNSSMDKLFLESPNKAKAATAATYISGSLFYLGVGALMMVAMSNPLTLLFAFAMFLAAAFTLKLGKMAYNKIKGNDPESLLDASRELHSMEKIARHFSNENTQVLQELPTYGKRFGFDGKGGLTCSEISEIEDFTSTGIDGLDDMMNLTNDTSDLLNYENDYSNSKENKAGDFLSIEPINTAESSDSLLSRGAKVNDMKIDDNFRDSLDKDTGVEANGQEQDSTSGYSTTPTLNPN